MRCWCGLKKCVVVAVAFFMAWVWFPPGEAAAGEYGAELSQGALQESVSGYRIFRSVCKRCHTRENGKAPFLHAESKTPRGWERVFRDRYPRCARDGSWNGLSEKEVQQLRTYLKINGRDTFDPDELRYGTGIFGIFF